MMGESVTKRLFSLEDLDRVTMKNSLTENVRRGWHEKLFPVENAGGTVMKKLH